jgi:LPS export ABC transporter protein LptC
VSWRRTSPLPLILPLALLGLLVGACQGQPTAEDSAPPFVFRELNLRQRDAEGRPLWEIGSPETRYDLSRRLAQARDLTGVLYRDGQPLYKLTASNAVVVNDGEVIQLEGPTRLERLDPERPAVLTALRLRWYPAQERMEIDRAPKLVQGDLELTAGLARFLIGAERLELRRAPVLRQLGAEPVRLELGLIDWLAASGDLTAKGPVRGQRQLRSGGQQRLTAPSLRGNTLAQTLDLQAPVRLEDPSRKAVLNAQLTRLHLQDRTASSGLPFQGSFGQTQISGGGFVLNAAASTVAVQKGCRLQQPEEQLTARQCFWNWRDGTARATGQVVLQRDADGFESRAEQLLGRIGDDGFVEFSTPGGRVQTQLRLPAPGGESPRTPAGSATPSRSDRVPAFQL